MPFEAVREPVVARIERDLALASGAGLGDRCDQGARGRAVPANVRPVPSWVTLPFASYA
jgi:hypothetical protein